MLQRLLSAPCISIHALQAECDFAHLGEQVVKNIISIHALQAECDSIFGSVGGATAISIHALQAECDISDHGQSAVYPDFYPRTPSGVRLYSGL